MRKGLEKAMYASSLFLIVALLPVNPPQMNDAEKLVREMEQKTVGAKTLHVVFEGSLFVVEKDRKTPIKGEVKFAEQGKSHFIMESESLKGPLNITLICDGK